jgi:hypothetical protein
MSIPKEDTGGAAAGGIVSPKSIGMQMPLACQHRTESRYFFFLLKNDT